MSRSPLARIALPIAAVALLLPLVALPAHATDVPDFDADRGSVDRGSEQSELAPVSGADVVDRVWVPAPHLDSAAVGAVDGRILVTPIEGGSPVPATDGNTLVRFWLLQDERYYLQAEVEAFDSEGDFVVNGLTAGTYRIEVLSADGGWPGKTYFDGADFWSEATNVTFSDITGYSIPTITVDPILMDSGRISGADRYATSVAISQSIAPGIDGLDVVYLASGTGYADALSAGPAAAIQGGALLLTQPNALPAVVADELERLNPSTVVIVGGTGTVSSRVVSQVAAVVSADIVRLSGADRYATSRAVVDYAWPDGVDVLGVATGRTFPDALAAGAAVASAGGAVLLVDGARTSLDATSRGFISALQPEYVAIAGGTGSVTSGIASNIALLSGSPIVERFGGADRYATARSINAEFFGQAAPDYAFLATGTGFADALAGGPLAAAFGAPIYLSTPQCLSVDTYLQIAQSFVREVYALGGTGTLSNRVLNGELC